MSTIILEEIREISDIDFLLQIRDVVNERLEDMRCKTISDNIRSNIGIVIGGKYRKCESGIRNSLDIPEDIINIVVGYSDCEEIVRFVEKISKIECIYREVDDNLLMLINSYKFVVDEMELVIKYWQSRKRKSIKLDSFGVEYEVIKDDILLEDVLRKVSDGINGEYFDMDGELFYELFRSFLVDVVDENSHYY
jgi:hypothetical protein